MTSARDTWRFRRSKTLWLRDVLLMVGVGVCAGLSWQIGVQEILAYLQRLGWRFVFVLLPFLLVFICDTFGWRYAYAEPPPVSFLRLLALQIIGTAVNSLTPLAPVGGEPVKAYLLQSVGVPFSEGLAGVVIARTMATMAQGIFVLVITVVTCASLGLPWPLVQAVTVALGVGAVLVTAFLIAQTHGLFTGLLGMALRLRHGLSRLQEGARDVDRRIASFYRQRWDRCVLSLACHLLGWLVEGVEVYVLLRLMHLSSTAAMAIGIAALSSAVRAASFVIPASLGIQEGGNLVIFTSFGLPADAAMAFSLLRRMRELGWVAIGVFLWRRFNREQPRGAPQWAPCGFDSAANPSDGGASGSSSAAAAVRLCTVVKAHGQRRGEVKRR